MELQKVIDENREVLIDYIRQHVPRDFILDDAEIEEWILNDSYLYEWALGEGVDV